MSGKGDGSNSWSARYGYRHRQLRLLDFPTGITPPVKVRVYSRRDHYVLQWWDPAAKATLSDRVNGDLVSAITRAREIDDRLLHYRSAGSDRGRKVSHANLVEAFQQDLVSRADAGEIDARTVARYRAALAHYLVFCSRPDVQKSCPHASKANRDFRLAFVAFLANGSDRPNGNELTTIRPMRGGDFEFDIVRAMYEWAADPDRGGLLPEGFRNPFLRSGGKRNVFKGDPLSSPDVTLDMAVQLVNACDRFQLRLFGTILLFGLRAAEPCFLFREDLQERWLLVANRPEIDLKTKGRRDKRFPFPKAIEPFLRLLGDGRRQGLLFRRRAVDLRRDQAVFIDYGPDQLTEEYQRRLSRQQEVTAEIRRQTRDRLFHEAGGITYDHIEGEFRSLAKRLKWPAVATIKDLRHLFATSMTNAGMPEAYLRYLMGHAPGRAALVAYTHLHELERHYARALESEWRPLTEAISDRIRVLESEVGGKESKPAKVV